MADTTAGIRLEASGEKEFSEGLNSATGSLDKYSESAEKASGKTSALAEALDQAKLDQARAADMEAFAEASAALSVGIIQQAESAAKLVGAFFDAADSTAEYGDEIDKTSQKLGLSRRAYQEWNYILGQNGASINSMKSAMQQLAKVQEGLTQTAAEDLEAVGLSSEAIQDMSREELFAAVIEGLQGMEESSARTVLAQRLLGSGYKELQPLLNSTAGDTEALRQRFYELGGYMSDEAVKEAAAYSDSVADLNLKWDAFQRDTMSKFLPALTELRQNIIDNDSLDRLADKAATLAESGIGLITFLVDHSNEAVAAIKAIGGAWATWQAAKIVGTLVTNVSQLVGWLEALGAVLGVGAAGATAGVAGVGLGVWAVADYRHTLKTEGYLGNGKELEEYAANVAYYEEQIAQWHAQNDEYLRSGYTEGVDMLQNELAVLEAGLRHAEEEYTAAQASAYGWGEDMMIEFANGVTSGAEKFVKPAIDSVTGMINRNVGFSEPEEGVLSDFHTYAPDMMQLFAQGIEEGAPLVRRAVSEAFDFRPTVEAGFGGGSAISYGGVNVTFEVQPGQDGRALFEEFSYWLQTEMANERAVFAQ